MKQNPSPMLLPIFIKHSASLTLLTKGGLTCVLLRLLTALCRHSDLIVATNLRVIKKTVQDVGIQAIFMPDVNVSESVLPLPGWQEACTAYFDRKSNDILIIADFSHSFPYAASISSLAEAWIRSNRPVAFAVEKPKIHPCQVDICFSKRIEAIAYLPVSKQACTPSEDGRPLKLTNFCDISSNAPGHAGECWAIPVVDGSARGDLLEVVASPGDINVNGASVFNSPSDIQGCFFLWLSETQPAEDPLTIPLEMEPMLWKAGPDGTRYLTNNDRSITGRQMFPEVHQISPALIMVRRESWENVRVYLEKGTFHPLFVDRILLNDPELDATLGLIELYERL